MVEKNPNGWWFINIDELQGWVPATYLTPVEKSSAQEDQPIKTPHGKSFISISAFTGKETDEIAFDKGVVIQVWPRASVIHLSVDTCTGS